MMNVKRNLTIAVDFDGTLSCNATWPNIGQPNQNLFSYLKNRQKTGIKLSFGLAETVNCWIMQ